MAQDELRGQSDSNLQPITGADPNSVMAAISSTIVYADPRNDITNDVIYNLNRLYKATAAPAAKPANENPAQAASPPRPTGMILKVFVASRGRAASSRPLATRSGVEGHRRRGKADAGVPPGPQPIRPTLARGSAMKGQRMQQSHASGAHARPRG